MAVDIEGRLNLRVLHELLRRFGVGAGVDRGEASCNPPPSTPPRTPSPTRSECTWNFGMRTSFSIGPDARRRHMRKVGLVIVGALGTTALAAGLSTALA